MNIFYCLLLCASGVQGFSNEPKSCLVELESWQCAIAADKEDRVWYLNLGRSSAHSGMSLTSRRIFFFFLAFSRAAPDTLVAHGVSQARGLIRAVAASLGLDQSHSNAGSEPCLRPTPQFMAMPDP